MDLRCLGVCLASTVALGAQSALAQPTTGCPDGHAIQSSDMSGRGVKCIPVPDGAALQEQINAEAATREQGDATLLTAINDETEARKTAIQALQDSMSSETTRCYVAHFVRAGGSEMRFTVLTFNNGDLHNAAVIQRLTFRDADGNVLHDSGPKIGVPHPLTRAPIPPRDITTVPPGGSYGFSTSDLWGFNTIPGYEAKGLEAITVQVEVSKEGKRSLFAVHSREIARDRFLTPTGPTVGAERAANHAPCFPVDPS